MTYQDHIVEIGLHIKKQEEKINRFAARFHQTVKTLYEIRQILERDYEVINKVKVPISEEERIRRALEIIKPKTPSGPLNKID